MTRPSGPDTYPRGSTLSRSFLPLALIALGAVFLLSNLLPDRSRGGLIILGLAAACVVGRVTTGRYGYAVPAGILSAFGAYILLHDALAPHGIDSASGLFFVLLGLGFGMVYLVGLRPASIWPLFLAGIFVGLGLVMLGAATLGPLASFSWLAAYWPVALVLIGAWLLFREALPVPVRKPIATIGGLALLAYGVLAAAANVAAGGALPAVGFGGSPFTDTLTLDAPISNGQTFTVDNPSGPTTIHVGSGQTVQVTATRHAAMGGPDASVTLTPGSDGVTLSSSAGRGGFPFGDSSWVEYAVEVPAGVAVNAQSGSGQLLIDGVNGAVTATSSSGRVSLSNLGGPVQVRSSSGAIGMSNLSGPLRVTSTSGSIQGTQLQHVAQVTTNSGRVSLEGVYTESAQVNASSGSVDVKLLPGTAVQLDVHTGSGKISPEGGLVLSSGLTRRDTLTGTLGSPAPGATLSIQTSSGNVVVSQ